MRGIGSLDAGGKDSVSGLLWALRSREARCVLVMMPSSIAVSSLLNLKGDIGAYGISVPVLQALRACRAQCVWDVVDRF